ncbi:MAG: hypothetical protein JO180_10915 [Gemmatirosa sp.]|nr:hypothetical protein [Gemmatirosa sp.]
MTSTARRPHRRRRAWIAGAIALAAACHDPAPAEPLPVLSLAPTIDLLDVPTADSLPRRGLELTLRVTAHSATHDLRSLTLTTDPGTPDSVTRQVLPFLGPGRDPSAPLTLWAAPLAPGRHTFAVRAVDDSGRVATSSFSRVLHVPDAAYALAELPSPLGGDAAATGLNAAGVVVGSYVDAAQRQRALRWTTPATPAELPAPGTVDAYARRVNAAGDVLGAIDRRAVVWRADGALLRFPGTLDADTALCCRAPIDLSDSRVAFATWSGISAVLLDVPTGTARDLGEPRGATGVALDDLGRTVGYAMTGMYSSGAVSWTGDVRLTRPSLRLCPECLGHPDNQFPVALGDNGSVLSRMTGQQLVYGDATTPALSLDSYVGPTNVGVMDRAGANVVALIPGDSALYVFHVADRSMTRVAPTEPGWRFDALGAVNDRGQIAAHAVHAPSGRRRAVLLTPVAR